MNIFFLYYYVFQLLYNLYYPNYFQSHFTFLHSIPQSSISTVLMLISVVVASHKFGLSRGSFAALLCYVRAVCVCVCVCVSSVCG